MSPTIVAVVEQHAEEVATLRVARSMLVRAPHIGLAELRRHDERIEAHLDGLAVAGTDGLRACMLAMSTAEVGEAFALTERALDSGERVVLDRVLGLAEAAPEIRRGLLSAFGWLRSKRLQGVVASLVVAADPGRRAIGIDVCRLHGVDPGPTIVAALRDESRPLRAVAARAIGEAGAVHDDHRLLDQLADDTNGLSFWAARSAVLLGNRDVAIRALERLANMPLSESDEALALALMAGDFERGRETIHAIARAGSRDPQRVRRVVRACGWLGDANYGPWLIDLMADVSLARVAGEALSLITGVDLAASELSQLRPAEGHDDFRQEASEGHPGLDADEGLAWPDPDRVRSWWITNVGRLPVGQSSFLGAAVSANACADVLRHGLQRHRIVAAIRLKLLQPERAMFNVCAPAKRQLRQLAAL